MLKTKLGAVVLGALMSCSALAQTTLLSGYGVDINDNDVRLFIEQAIPEDQHAAILTDENTLKEIAKSILVTRAMAKFSKEVKEIENARTEWVGRYQTDNQLKDSLLTFETKEALADVNWGKLAEDVYNKDNASFTTPAKNSASHILFMTKTRSDEEALALAHKARERALAGEDFATLALELSEDPSAKLNSGSLGLFGPGKMVQAFEAAVNLMSKKGELSEPIKTPYGYHVIQFDKRIEGRLQSLDEVKPLILTELKQRLASKFKTDRIKALGDDKNLTVNDAGFSKFKNQAK